MSKRSHLTSGLPGGQRRSVLSEEEYTATLSSIVQRDYFPDVPNLERQAALLEKRAQGDLAGAAAVRRAARRLADHEEALAALEADDEHDVDESNVRRKARPLHQESITGFHARVTNEDDEEFDSNQKKEVAANRERLEKLFRPQDDSSKPLMLTNNMASDQFEAESNRIAASEWNMPKVRNALFVPPTPLIHNSDKGTTETTKLLTSGSVAANHKRGSQQLATIMPPPANRSNKKNVVIPKHALVEYVPKHASEKKIEPSQTRFPDRIVPIANRALTAAPLGNDNSETDGSWTDASTDLDSPMKSIERERRSRKRQQDKDKNSFVSMTPLVVPGAGNQSPITTWGTIDSTPIVLSGQEHDASDKTSTKSKIFSLPGENDRDRAARKAEKELARRAKRAKTSRSGRDSLTPAARSLLERTKRTPSRPRDAFASALRSSYTPKPRPSSSRRSSSSRRQHDSAHKSTPLISRMQK